MTPTVSQPSTTNAMRHLKLLTAGAIGIWAVTAGAGWLLRGAIAVEGSTYAGLLCLIPGWLVVYVSDRYPESRSPAAAILMGTGLRLAFALIGTLTFINLRPDLLYNERREVDLWRFVVWLLCYYLAFLFIETLLIVGNDRAQDA